MGTLKAFSFNSGFVGFLQQLCTTAECLVKLNRVLGFRRGVSQGCPIPAIAAPSA